MGPIVVVVVCLCAHRHREQWDDIADKAAEKDRNKSLWLGIIAREHSETGNEDEKADTKCHGESNRVRLGRIKI